MTAAENTGVDAWIAIDVVGNSAGDGSNLNTKLAVSGIERGLDTLEFTITNSGPAAVLTKVQVRGGK